MKEQIIKILESYIVDNIGETSPKIDIDAIPTIANEILALQLQQTGVIKSLPDYELEFCKKCFQMTNHLSNKCQKCKGNVL